MPSANIDCAEDECSVVRSPCEMTRDNSSFDLQLCILSLGVVCSNIRYDGVDLCNEAVPEGLHVRRHGDSLDQAVWPRMGCLIVEQAQTGGGDRSSACMNNVSAVKGE